VALKKNRVKKPIKIITIPPINSHLKAKRTKINKINQGKAFGTL